MPKSLNQQRTPAEIRAARIRATFLSLFGVLLVALLLSVAWAGIALTRRTPPTSASLPGVSVQGTLTFDVPIIVRNGLHQLALGEDAVESDLKQQVEPILRGTLHQRAQVFFYEDSRTEVQWAAWLPTRRPQRVAHEEVARLLAATSYFSGLGSSKPENESFAGWFQSQRQGFLLSSQLAVPGIRVERTPVQGQVAAEYVTSSDLVLDAWLEAVPRPQAEAIRSGVVRQILWHSPAADQSGGRVEFFLEDSTVETPWFNPLLPLSIPP